MDQRRPRLGDVVDDYCPRERRLTNHAVVAIVGDDIKQTRCTTCDAEHVYKGARIPPARRKKEGGGGGLRPAAGLPARIIAADDESSSMQHTSNGAAPDPAPPPVVAAAAAAPAAPAPRAETIAAPARQPVAAPPPAPEPIEEPAAPAAVGEEVRMRRSLIRATLPRPEGQQATRPVPEFTMRTPTPGRNGNFRGESRPPRGPGKPGGQRFAKPQGAGGRGGNVGSFGQGRGNRSVTPAQPHGPRRPQSRHGKKRPKH
jgi:hypothetical protein